MVLEGGREVGRGGRLAATHVPELSTDFCWARTCENAARASVLRNVEANGSRSWGAWIRLTSCRCPPARSVSSRIGSYGIRTIICDVEVDVARSGLMLKAYQPAVRATWEVTIRRSTRDQFRRLSVLGHLEILLEDDNLPEAAARQVRTLQRNATRLRSGLGVVGPRSPGPGERDPVAGEH